jgi:hypothetical protein
MLAQVGIALLVVTEAIVEKYVIRMKSPETFNYKKNNRLEHKWSAVHYCIMVGVISMSLFSIGGMSVYQLFLLLSISLLTRWVIFNPLLNYLRDIDIFYLSDEGIDGFVKKKLGKNYGIKNMIISLAALIILKILLWITLA